MTRLERADIARIRAQHPITAVLVSFGVQVPHAGRRFMIHCPSRAHRDSRPSCLIDSDRDRFHCFGCHAGGDIFSLVHELTGVGSLSAIAALLDAAPTVGSPSSRGRDASDVYRLDASPEARRTPVTAPTVGTPPDVVLAINDEAWRFLTEAPRARRAQSYLLGRGIDLAVLQARCGPVAGHTPVAHQGLTSHLLSLGFTATQIIDAGWSAHYATRLTDRFRDRVIFAARDQNQRVVGAYGRDITGASRCKYLNTGQTATFAKRRVLYLPVWPVYRPRTVVLCEGPVDALAIAAAAARGARSPDVLAASPSGTALSAEQADIVASFQPGRVVVCPDADQAGRLAAVRWQATLAQHGVSSAVRELAEGLDPAALLAAAPDTGLDVLLDDAAP